MLHKDKAGKEVSDTLLFLRAWIKNPLKIAAVAPSGKALASLMTSEITVDSGPIIELGPGTGAFTCSLLSRGLTEKDLTLIEYDANFARILKERFPSARVLSMDAAHLGKASLFEASNVGAVISGLPILSMPPKKVIGILSGAFHYLRQGGAFYQFTYTPRCPIARPILDRLGLKASRMDRALLNVPPAAVYRITRRPSRTGAAG